jgi:hypothetical protein
MKVKVFIEIQDASLIEFIMDIAPEDIVQDRASEAYAINDLVRNEVLRRFDWRWEKVEDCTKRALAALEQIKLIGDEQEHRASLEYLQSVLHEYRAEV